MLYRGRTAALATQHGKLPLLARPLAAGPGLALCAPAGIDTDALGTFSGEVPRPGPPEEVVERKARLAMAAAGTELGLATEATFGPHPALPFLGGHTELIAFVDDARGVVHLERLTTAETNFASLDTVPGADLTVFLERAGFPAHALIVRPAPEGAPVAKGVQEPTLLAEAVAAAAAASPLGQARIEADMRAHLNPTRRRIIRKLAIRLARRLSTLCPECELPGFGPVGHEAGLPCADCGAPTGRTAAVVWGCLDGRTRARRPVAATAADPGDCPVCNP